MTLLDLSKVHLSAVVGQELEALIAECADVFALDSSELT